MSGVIIAETAGAIISVLGEIQSLAGNRRAPHRQHRRLVDALRRIYFTPYGTMNVLEALSRGERPSRDVIETVLPRFNDAEWEVQRELRFLESEELFASRAFALRDTRILREIAYGKRDIRRFLQDLLNDALTHDRPVDTNQVIIALKAVKALNSSIELIEALYNHEAP